MSAVSQQPDSESDNKLVQFELQLALARANSTMLAQALLIEDMRSQITMLSTTVGELCRLKIEGNHEKLNAELARLAANYQRIVKALAKRKLH